MQCAMKVLMSLFLCMFSCASLWAQVNYVKNPGLEEYTKCPNDWNQIIYSKDWSIPGDSTTTSEYSMEYYNVCGNSTPDYKSHIPVNAYFYGYPHSGNGMAGGQFYYDKTLPPPPGLIPFNYRDYLVGRLIKSLTAGKTYCVSFWVNLAEAAGVGQNKLGAYLDNGTINTLPDTLGAEITSVMPQVYTNTVIMDTANWTKIEGNFTATGNETYITIGNFFPNDSVTTVVANYWFFGTQYSYYLIDDISVVESGTPADAGADRWVEETKTVQIGRVGDSTAKVLDCKWYHKGSLIDSGAIITVNAAATKGIVDTYVVVQTICGVVKTDTVLVTTVGLGINNIALQNASFSVYPNPGDGAFIIRVSDPSFVGMTNAGARIVTVYDMLGRVIQQEQLSFSNNQSSIKVDVAKGTYILQLQDEAGNISRQRISIQ